jgi:dihydroorotase-like cyclic amidohydrolase
VQTLLPSLYSEAVVKRGVALERFAALISGNPARIFGLAPRKGRIAIGSDADVTLLDPTTTWTISVDDALHKNKWTPFEGKEVAGRVVRTIRRGETIFDDSFEGEHRMKATPGTGRFLPRSYGATSA